MATTSEIRWRTVAGAFPMAVAMVSAVVLTLSMFVTMPTGIVTAAWIGALAGAALAWCFAWADSRSADVSLGRSLLEQVFIVLDVLASPF